MATKKDEFPLDSTIAGFDSTAAWSMHADSLPTKPLTVHNPVDEMLTTDAELQ